MTEMLTSGWLCKLLFGAPLVPLNKPVEPLKRPVATSKAVVGINWIAEQLGLSERQTRRLAVQRLLPGVYRSQKRGRWKVRKVEFLDSLESWKTKSAWMLGQHLQGNH